MRNSYCYLPIVPARGGAFLALTHLSPLAESRLVPFFDIPGPVLRSGDTLEAHFAKRAKAISDTWTRNRSAYVDMHNLPTDVRMASGAHPLTYIFEQLNMHCTQAIPVTGTPSDRDAEYSLAVRTIVRRDRRGVLLRIAREDMENRSTLSAGISEALDFLGITPVECDLLFDFRYILAKEVNQLRTVALEVLQIATRLGNFQNLIVAGGSIPEQLGKQTKGQVRLEPRVEFGLWSDLVAAFPVVFADYGVLSPLYVPPKGFVNVPSRIRYSTTTDHVFRRGAGKEYSDLCKALIASPYFSGQNFSWGDHRLFQCAKENINPGNAKDWVASDTNHHLELVADQVWRTLESAGLAGRFSLSDPVRRPWLQPELIFQDIQ
jgi:Beta protein